MFKFIFALLSMFVLTTSINAQVTDHKFEVGGFFTFYPAERAIIRVDAGNTFRYQDRPRGTFGSSSIVDGGFKSNFQVSLGFGWRF